MAFTEGDLRFRIAVFEKDEDGAWSQVQKGATLRVAVYDLDGEHDVFSQGFVTSATDLVERTVPRHVVGMQPFDLWVTIHRADGSVATSHYSAQKNAAIIAGQYDVADALDHHHVFPVSLG